MPLNIDFVQILLHLFNFVLLFGGLTLLLFRPINKFLEERRAYFENAEREIADKTAENAALQAEYEQKRREADAEIAAQRADAERELSAMTKATLDQAKAKADAMIAAAEQEAEARKEHILDAAQTEISELVVAAAQKLLSDTVTPERNAALYDEFIRLADETVADKRGST